jgi:coenzyme F420-0:L-glutamate ligase/coenzyme F420-1:gamma-L-glutamate ligase
VSGALEILPLAGMPEVGEGDDIASLIAGAAREPVRAGDIVVVSQKIVSKAEGRIRDLALVRPGAEALATAARTGKDPRLVELVLGEAASVLRAEPGVIIVRTHSGLVCANAGIDASNVPGAESVTLLPEDGDASARRIRAGLRPASGQAPAVVVADSFGRPWRLGQTDVAIGCAGLVSLDDWRGRADRGGRELAATAIAIADEAAAAADLARDKTMGLPVVVIRGLERFVTRDDGPGAAALRRPESEDLFG